MVILRLVQRNDLDQIMSIEQQSFRYPFTFSTFEMLLQNSPELFLVATHRVKDSQEILGYAVAQLYDAIFADEKKSQSHFIMPKRMLPAKPGLTGHIVSIAVHPRYRRQGIGSKLMDKLLKLLQDRKCVQVRLEVKVTDKAAHALYDKFGFRQVGVIPGYYNEKEDAAVFLLDWEGQ